MTPATLPRTPFSRLPLSPAQPIGKRTETPDRRENPRRVLRRQVTKRELKHLGEVAEAVATIDRLPARDESIHCIMPGSFHAWDLVPAVLRLAAPAVIKSLFVATLGFNTRNAGELLRFVDEGKIREVTFLCSAYFQKASTAEFEILRAGLVDRGQNIKATRTHCKIIAARLTDSRCIVVESSANLRSCNNLEQFAMTESPELFDFHAKWIREVAAA